MFFHVFPLFLLFFIFYSLIFLLFSLKNVSSFFHFVSLLFFSRVPKICGGTPGFLGEVHILSWLHLLCIGSSSLFLVE